jgi:hypothetical protein
VSAILNQTAADSGIPPNESRIQGLGIRPSSRPPSMLASQSRASSLARPARLITETRGLPLYVGGKAKNRAYKPEPKQPYSKDCHDEN